MATGAPKYTTIAKNRKPRYEQQGPALSQLELSRQQISTLHIEKSARRYNDPGRLMPGAEFLYKGDRYIMTGQLTGGKYYRATDQGKRNFPVRDCIFIKENRGLVYAS